MNKTEQSRQAAQAAARQARESKARKHHQANVQQVASDIKSQIPGMSPQVAESMGNALDPTAGYDFTPGARPADLPMPGQAPGGEAQRNPQSFTGNTIGDMANAELEDDHDELVGPGIGGGGELPPGVLPPGVTGPPKRPPQKPQFKTTADPKPEHPILTKLRQDLGIEEIRTHDVKIGGHVWTMTMLTPSMLALASRMADTFAEGITERQMTYQAAIAAYSIVAIDGVPTYDVFGVEPPPNITITNHLNPPKPIRYLSASRVFAFIHEQSRTQLPERLFDAYEDKVDQLGGVSSYLDDPINQRRRFRCQEDLCAHEVFIIPRFKPGTRDVQLPFCMWHGTPMELIGEEEDKENPLP